MLYFGDFDPSGIDIERDLSKRLERYGAEDFIVQRIALTNEQIKEYNLPPIPVKQIMMSDVVKATKNTPVHEVADKMIKNNISHIPVVDSDDRLLGMVTDIDLMACWV